MASGKAKPIRQTRRDLQIAAEVIEKQIPQLAEASCAGEWLASNFLSFFLESENEQFDNLH